MEFLLARLYRCKSWLCSDLKAAYLLYHATLKHLPSTWNDLVRAKFQLPDIGSMVKTRPATFFQTLTTRPLYSFSYLKDVITMCIPAGKSLVSVAETCVNFLLTSLTNIAANIHQVVNSATWLTGKLIPGLLNHVLYSADSLPEHFGVWWSQCEF